ncbi:MAG TPA: VOC family protein [Candidatus Dormibacteraeota bacterium]|nr:VOC family protein [Candidatus Dormibacteraeota bacterium]
MAIQKNVIEPYLFFEGRCEEAVEFYKKAVDAEVVMMMRFKDAPDPNACAGVPGEKIMHSTLRIGGSNVMASDGRCEHPTKFQGFSLSLGVSTEAEANKYFDALGQGGQVIMPLAKTFWSPRFGMVTDKFGIMWMVTVLTEQKP